MSDIKNVKDELNSIVTISNKRVPRKNCIKIREKYHEKLVDCFQINGKWTSIHYNTIALDVYTNEYNYVKKLHSVVLAYDRQSKQATLGYSSVKYNTPFKLYTQPATSDFFTIDSLAFDKLELQECPTSGGLYPFGDTPFKKNAAKYRYKEDDFNYAISLKKAKVAGLDPEKIEEFGLTSKTFKKCNKLKYSFGVEVETAGGLISKNLANGKLNIDYLYDGSVYSNSGEKYGGGEIVTGVLVGDAGFNHLKTIMDVAKSKCVVNPTCGVHTHIGGWKYTPEFIVNAYALGYYIQDDLFTYMPKKRQYQVDYSGKITGNNVHCKKLPLIKMYEMYEAKSSDEYKKSVEENYKQVFKWLCGRVPSESLNKSHDHPKGKKCGFDHESPRYSWLNLVPATFNTRKNGTYTLEFRSHGETLNYNKIYYWTLFCFAFVSFCENHSNHIAKGFIERKGVKYDINVLSIIETIFENNIKLQVELINYFKARQLFFTNNEQALESTFNY